MNRNGMSHSEAGKLGAEASKESSHQRHERFVEVYAMEPKVCKHCGAVLPYEKRFSTFCNSSCAATFNNTKFPKRQADTAQCLNCGKLLTRSNFKYCGNKCQQEYEWKQRCASVEESGVFPEDVRLHETNRKFVRKFLEEKEGHKCTLCGREIWEGSEIPLTVDHIDGDSTNHNVSNLRLICPNCDAQLPTFKNRGNHKSTRTWRAQYYSKK